MPRRPLTRLRPNYPSPYEEAEGASRAPRGPPGLLGAHGGGGVGWGLTRVGVPGGRGAICREPQGRATQAARRDPRPGRVGQGWGWGRASEPRGLHRPRRPLGPRRPGR